MKNLIIVTLISLVLGCNTTKNKVNSKITNKNIESIKEKVVSKNVNYDPHFKYFKSTTGIKNCTSEIKRFFDFLGVPLYDFSKLEYQHKMETGELIKIKSCHEAYKYIFNYTERTKCKHVSNIERCKRILFHTGPENLGCISSGIEYKDGESFKDAENCNTCKCENGNIGCTNKGCIKNEDIPMCVYKGEVYFSFDKIEVNGKQCECVFGDVVC